MDIETLSAIGTLLSAVATFVMVQIFYKQLKQEWRAVPVIIRPPLKTKNKESNNLREEHLLLKNFGGGPALNINLYLSSSEFKFNLGSSLEIKLSRPLAPGIMYELQIIGVEAEKTEKSDSISDNISFNKEFNESEEVIQVLVFEPDQVLNLPDDIKALITFEDITGQKRWVKYAGKDIKSAKQTYGKGDPDFLFYSEKN